MRILFLDDDGTRHDYISNWQIDHPDVEIHHVWSAPEAIKALNGDNGRYDIASLDHDFGGDQFVSSSVFNTGHTVAQYITRKAEEVRPKKIIIHSYNPVGAQNMCNTLHDSGIRSIIAPFGPKMLTYYL